MESLPLPKDAKELIKVEDKGGGGEVAIDVAVTP